MATPTSLRPVSPCLCLGRTPDLDGAPCAGERAGVSDDPSQTPAAPPETPPNDAAQNPWQRLNEWRAAGVPKTEWLARLKQAGFDEESARILVNSLEGANPAALPEASIGGTNPLTPGSFALGELGLQGDPFTVGLYWLAFGGTIGVLVAVFVAMVWADVVEAPEEGLFVLARVMGTLATLAIGWGVGKILTSVRVRRR